MRIRFLLSCEHPPAGAQVQNRGSRHIGTFASYGWRQAAYLAAFFIIYFDHA